MLHRLWSAHPQGKATIVTAASSWIFTATTNDAPVSTMNIRPLLRPVAAMRRAPVRSFGAGEPFIANSKAPKNIIERREILTAGGTWQGALHPTWLKDKFDIPVAGVGFLLQGGVLLGFITGLYKMAVMGDKAKVKS